MANQTVSNETLNQCSIRLVGNVRDMKTNTSSEVCQHNGKSSSENSATTWSQLNMCYLASVNENLKKDINNGDYFKMLFMNFLTDPIK